MNLVEKFVYPGNGIASDVKFAQDIERKESELHDHFVP